MRNILILFVILGTVDSVSIIIQKFVLSYTRFFGFAGVPSVDLVVSSSLLLFIFSVLNSYRKESDYVYPIAFTLNIIALYFMQTRNSILSFVLGLIGMMIILYQSGSIVIRKKLVTVLLVFAGLFAAFVYISFLSDSTDDKTNRYAMETNTKGLKLSSFHTRILIWDTALTVFLENPVLGVGFNTFSMASKDYYTIKKDLFDLFVRDLDAHLPYLDLIAGTGLLGGLIFLFVFYKLMMIINDGCRQFSVVGQDYPYFIAISVVNLTIILSFFYSGSWFYGQNSFQMILFWACLVSFQIPFIEKREK